MTDVATRGAREGEGGTTQHVVPWTDRALPWVVGLAALYPAGLVLRGAVARPADFLKNVLEGVSLGGVYALIALGYTMVYGVLGLINFAHSDVFMVGAYVGIFAAAFFGVVATSTEGASLPGWWPASPRRWPSAPCSASCIERFAYRPVRRAPKLTPLVTAIGVSMLLQNVGILACLPPRRGAFPPSCARAPSCSGPSR
jgi:branched-subunit amino acid ABC-type transport system permease component